MMITMFKIKMFLKEKWIYVLTVFGILLFVMLAFIFITAPNGKYYYIDYNEQKGVANKCWENDDGLYCDRLYGGKIKVLQYWKV